MAFFVYIAILLVSISGILLELDWLTNPKLETKSPVQRATAILPAPKAKAKVEGLSAKLAPVYPNQATEPRVIAPIPASPQSTAQSGLPQQQPRSETTGAAPPAELAEPSAAANAPTTPSPTASVKTQDTSAATPAKCDVQSCASAYQSFRAADCTYQPFEGPRRICEKPPAARSERVTPRRLRPVAQDRVVVRGDVDDDDADDARGERRVIVIERPAVRPW